MQPPRSDLILVGRITAVHGIKGWLKVWSYTQPLENVVEYQPWWLASGDTGAQLTRVDVDECATHGRGLIVHIKGVDEREFSRQYCNKDIYVSRNQLPALPADEYYWQQIEGMKVVSHFAGKEYFLGVVRQIIETGANDVLVVAPAEGSIDQTERLVPWVRDLYIKAVDTQAKIITVEWDPAF